VLRSGAMARRIVREQEGVTLTELLIVISLLSVVVIAAYLLFDAVSGMADLRQAQEIQDGGGAFAANMAPTDMSFYANVDRSSEAPELIRYRQSGARLLRSVRYGTLQVPSYGTYLPATPTETVVLSMMDPAVTTLFVGMNTSETATTDKALISSVEIRLRNGATAGRRTAYCEMTTKVKVRSVQNAIK
jgi:prepilin-type N-terminal cleavage/methylation domain-containing protein